ncbi:unnamed protein product [Ectocarpus sp. 13 AM-2016]
MQHNKRRNARLIQPEWLQIAFWVLVLCSPHILTVSLGRPLPEWSFRRVPRARVCTTDRLLEETYHRFTQNSRGMCGQGSPVSLYTEKRHTPCYEVLHSPERTRPTIQLPPSSLPRSAG